MINLELYRIFKIVADQGNITRASEILNISQPAVSKHIKNLEDQLDIKLFYREKYGMKLNENGIKLYEKIKDAVDIVINAETIFTTDKEIKLGVQVNIPVECYNKGISEFYKNNSKIIININKLTAINMLLALEKQEIDLGYGKEYDKEIYDNSKIKFEQIKEIEDVLIVNKNSKYLGKKMDKNDLKTSKIYTLKRFTKEYLNLIDTLNYSESEKENIVNINFAGILELLSSRDVIAFVPRKYVENQIKNGEYKVINTNFKFPKVNIGVYYNINNKFREQKKLIDELKSNF